MTTLGNFLARADNESARVAARGKMARDVLKEILIPAQLHQLKDNAFLTVRGSDGHLWLILAVYRDYNIYSQGGNWCAHPVHYDPLTMDEWVLSYVMFIMYDAHGFARKANVTTDTSRMHDRITDYGKKI